MCRLSTLALGLLFVVCAVPALAQTATVTAEKTNVREKPSATSAIIVAVSRGAELEVLEKAGTWYRVRVKPSGPEGYVNSMVVEVSGEATPPSPSPQPPAPARLAEADQPSPAGLGGGNERNFFIRVYGGLFSGFINSGPGFGGGIAARPFANKAMEIQGDFMYGRLGSWNYPDVYGNSNLSINLALYQGSGNFLYNFGLSGQKFTLFAGAGLAYSHTRYSATYAFSDYDIKLIDQAEFVSGLTFQAVGGIEWPLNDRTAFRAELRFGFPGVLLLGGLSF